MVGRRADDVLDAASAAREAERGAQRRQPGVHVALLRLEDAQRGQAVGVLGDRVSLLRHVDGACRQRQRLVELAEQHAPGRQGGENAGLQGGRRLSVEQRHRLLGGLNG